MLLPTVRSRCIQIYDNEDIDYSALSKDEKFDMYIKFLADYKYQNISEIMSFLKDFEKDHSMFHIYNLDSFLGVNFDDPPMEGAVAELKLPIDDTLLYRFTPKKPFLGFEDFFVAYDHLGEICFISAVKDCSKMSKASAEECLVDISKMFKKKYCAKPRYHFEGEGAQSFSLDFMDFCKENFRDVTVALSWEEGLKQLRVYAGDKLKLGAKVMMDRKSKSPEAAIDAL